MTGEAKLRPARQRVAQQPRERARKLSRRGVEALIDEAHARACKECLESRVRYPHCPEFAERAFGEAQGFETAAVYLGMKLGRPTIFQQRKECEARAEAAA